MRKTLFATAFFALALTSTLASAQTMPAGVKVTDGALTDAAGKPLYIYDNDTMKGMSHCSGQCARVWTPLIAPADAKPTADWTVVMREDGKHQWAYKDKPLYYYSKDMAGMAAMGGSIPSWHVAKP